MHEFHIRGLVSLTDDWGAERYILGMAISANLIREIGPHMVFVPSPNELYKIKPSSVFYVAVSEADARAPVPPSMKDQACKTDFEALRTTDILLLHTDRGELIVQAKSQL